MIGKNSSKKNKSYIEEFIFPTCEYFITYLMSGKVDQNVINKLRLFDIKSLDLNYFNLTTPLKIAFLRNKEVKKFIDDLDERLRRIKTSSSKRRIQSHGRVKGFIDWPQTIKLRNKSNPNNKTLFVFNSTFKMYDLPENLLLKKLIISFKKLFDDPDVTEIINGFNYDWLENIKSNQNQIDSILKNVHLRRIKTPKIVNNSMRKAAKCSRSKLYREAYKIFSFYEDLLRFFNKERIKKIIIEELIKPKNVWAVFELYVLFRFIQSLKNNGFKLININEIKEYRGETCVLRDKKNDLTVTFFYNVTGDDLSFISISDDVDKEAFKVSHQYFNKDLREGSRRPDIILKIDNNGKSNFLFIEVKYTNNPNYVLEGVYQVLDYLKLAKRSNQQLFANFGNGYNAIVATYLNNNYFPQIINKKINLNNQDLKVKIFDYKDLANNLNKFVKVFIKKLS